MNQNVQTSSDSVIDDIILEVKPFCVKDTNCWWKPIIKWAILDFRRFDVRDASTIQKRQLESWIEFWSVSFLSSKGKFYIA